MYNDVVHINLLQGGEIEGRAVATDGIALLLVIDEQRTRVEFAIVGVMTLVSREGTMPLPVVVPPPVQDSEAAADRERRARRRASGLAFASFLLPGFGQFANRQPVMGATYLAGILILDSIIALTLIVNQDPTVAIVMGILDIAARVSSAALARSESLRALRQVRAGRPGRARSTGSWLAWVAPVRDGADWSVAMGLSLRL